MFPAPFKVVLDANAIFPFSLRDTLLRAAAAGFFQVYWSAAILEEARRNLVDSRRMTGDQAMRPIRRWREFPRGNGDRTRTAHHRDEERREGPPCRGSRGEGRDSGHRNRQLEGLSRTARGH